MKKQQKNFFYISEMPSSPSTEQALSISEKLQEFVRDNWRVVLIGTAVSAAVAAGGLVYMSREADKRKARKQRKPSQASEANAPTPVETEVQMSPVPSELTEEVEPQMRGVSPHTTFCQQASKSDDKFVATSEENALESQEEQQEDDEQIQQDIDYARLSADERSELSMAAKSRGNKYFSAQKYDKAVTLYSKAIELYPNPNDKKVSVFYSNRSACWYNLGDYDRVIEDTSEALRIDPLYVKAMIRRGNAFEKKEMFTEALDDLTTACILEEFKVQPTLLAADRALKGLVAIKAKEISSTIKHHDLPSLSFVTAFLNSFRYDYKVPSDDQVVPGSGDALFIKAANAFARHDWEKADKYVNQALDASPQKYMARALNMRGTFKFLKGNSEAAKSDFEESLRVEPSVNTMIKMGHIQIEMDPAAGSDSALEWFNKAAELNVEDPDVFYHRGQIYFLLQDNENALKNYEQCLELDNNHALSKIQLAIVNYRMGNVDEATKIFETAKRQHPKNPDVFYYRGEIYLDQQKVEEAIAQFDHAISINPRLPLSYLNKGIVHFHIKGDLDGAIELVQKAIEVDPRCDLAFTHLAQMYMQQGKLDEAIITYKRAVDLSRTPGDIEAAVLGLEAVKAQTAAVQRINNAKLR